MPEDGSGLAGWITAAGIGVASAVKIYSDWRTARAIGSKASAETIDARTRADDSTFARAERLIKAQAERIDHLEEELGRLRVEVRERGDLADQLAQQIARRGMIALLDELSASADAARDIVDLLSDPMVVTRSDSGRFVAANAAMCALLGRSLPELLAGSWRDWIDPGDLRETETVEAAALARRVSTENRYRRPDGSLVRLRWDAMRYSKGGISVAVACEIPSP